MSIDRENRSRMDPSFDFYVDVELLFIAPCIHSPSSKIPF